MTVAADDAKVDALQIRIVLDDRHLRVHHAFSARPFINAFDADHGLLRIHDKRRKRMLFDIPGHIADDDLSFIAAILRQRQFGGMPAVFFCPGQRHVRIAAQQRDPCFAKVLLLYADLQTERSIAGWALLSKLMIDDGRMLIDDERHRLFALISRTVRRDDRQAIAAFPFHMQPGHQAVRAFLPAQIDPLRDAVFLQQRISRFLIGMRIAQNDIGLLRHGADLRLGKRDVQLRRLIIDAAKRQRRLAHIAGRILRLKGNDFISLEIYRLFSYLLPRFIAPAHAQRCDALGGIARKVAAEAAGLRLPVALHDQILPSVFRRFTIDAQVLKQQRC